MGPEFNELWDKYFKVRRYLSLFPPRLIVRKKKDKPDKPVMWLFSIPYFFSLTFYLGSDLSYLEVNFSS